MEKPVPASPSRVSNGGGPRPGRRLVLEGDLGEELHTQPAEEGLAEGALQPREVGRGAEWQEDGAAGR